MLRDYTKLHKNMDLEKLAVDELIKLTDVLDCFLETHRLDKKTEGELDVSGRTFNSEVYSEKEELLKLVWVEYFRRPVEEGIDTDL